MQDAKAQFSAVVGCALRGVPQHGTRRGKEAVVIVPAQDFAALQHQISQAANWPASLIEHSLAIPKALAMTKVETTGTFAISISEAAIKF